MESSILDLKSTCLERWRNGDKSLDERLQACDKNFESWYEQIPESNRPTVATLIEHLEYYSHRTTNAWLKALHGRLLKCPNVTSENTIYAFLKSKDGKTNSSNDYWTEYKAINQLNKNICIENMDVLDPEDWQYIQNIVFIDDFSGTGNTFIQEIQKHHARYVGKNIYFITINTMINAAQKIEKYCAENGISIVLLSVLNQEKAFERDLFEDNEKAKEEIRTMSSKFSIPKQAIFGYGKAQALVVFYNNTPNNTLGFIRCDTEKYNSLFPRRDDAPPTWMKMRKARHRRNVTNYNNKIEGLKDE